MSVEEELGALHRYELQDRYLELTRVELPAEARRRGWLVTEDHCFMRIILDHLFGDCWYNHLDRRLVSTSKLINGDRLSLSFIRLIRSKLSSDHHRWISSVSARFFGRDSKRPAKQEGSDTNAERWCSPFEQPS